MHTALVASVRPARRAGRTPRPAARGGHSTAWLWRMLGLLALLALWQLAAMAVDYRAVLPSPLEVVVDFTDSFFHDPGLAYLGVSSPGYAINILWTVGLAALGWAVGSLVGATVGLLSARLQWVRNASEPLLFVFGAIPALVLAPFCLVWFGQGPFGKFVLVAFYCFVSVGLVAQSAAASLPPAIEEYGATQGLDARARFTHIVVPAALPAVLSGLRVALSTGIAVQATVELLGSQFGAGRLIAIRATQGDVSAVLGLSIAIGVVAILLDVLLQRTIRIFTRWQ